MKDRRHKSRHAGAMIFFISLLTFLTIRSQDLISARVLNVAGDVRIERADRSGLVVKVSTSASDQLQPGDVIVCGRGGRLVLGLSDGSQAIIAEKTRVQVEDFTASPRTLLKVLSGKTRIQIEKLGGQPNPYRVNTPTAVIAVRGTLFDVFVKGDRTEVFVHEGEVAVFNLVTPNSELILRPGQRTRVQPNQPPEAPHSFQPSSHEGDFRERRQPDQPEMTSREDHDHGPDGRSGGGSQSGRQRGGNPPPPGGPSGPGGNSGGRGGHPPRP